MANSGYAVIDSDGVVRDVKADSAEAVRSAGRFSRDVRLEAGPESGGLSGLGAVPAAQMPDVSLRLSGLRRLDANKVMALSVERAHSLLLPYFPKSRTRKSGEVVKVATYLTANSMSRNLLGQNYKTSKETPERPSDVQGLSLMPYDLAARMSKRRLPAQGGLGLCAGSSAACRASCLVYSGHNAIDIYNMVVKTSRTEALLLKPEAFVRMLIENVNFHQDSARRRGFEPLVRLNVFSDVPWELVFPEMFYMFPNLRFYDYTKVPGRSPPANYDLTFSWSGVNEHFVRSELQRGRRVAVVFMLPGTLQTRRTASLPSTFMGMPVVDGDISDARPWDPAPGIVGLRWKLPLGSDAGKRTGGTSSFVVPVLEIEGVLVATQSARQEPITDPDTMEDAA